MWALSPHLWRGFGLWDGESRQWRWAEPTVYDVISGGIWVGVLGSQGEGGGLLAIVPHGLPPASMSPSSHPLMNGSQEKGGGLMS